jgi:putative oxidoreductase
MKKFLGLTWLPLNPDLGLLVLRLAVSWLMIRYHGWGKLTGWADEKIRLPNLFSLAGAQKEFHTFPNYLGISSELSYVLVTWCETFGSMAIMLGLATRLHAFGLFVTMLVAWGFHHGMRLTGPGAGELPFSWAFVYLLLLLAGPGRYSLDAKLGIGGTAGSTRSRAV